MNILEAVVLLSFLSYCAIGADLGQWGQWTACSKPCGPGQQTRSRPCVGRQECTVVQRTASRPCNKGPCQPGAWNDWTAFGPCSKTCGGGSKSRSRVCVGGGAGGPGCPGSAKDDAPCNPAPCPVGQWSQWNPFGPCSETCGAGQQHRIRNCIGGTNNCPGLAKDSRPCNNRVCSGLWAQWQPFGACNKTCGEGQHIRRRICSGGGCVGNSEETQRCNNRLCNPNWNEWGSWSACSQTCGQGMMTRSRVCSGGVGRCQGYGQFTDTCTKAPC